MDPEMSSTTITLVSAVARLPLAGSTRGASSSTVTVRVPWPERLPSEALTPSCRLSVFSPLPAAWSSGWSRQTL
jgi:hypothetical protein